VPSLEYFVVAEDAVIDSQTNRVSIFNVLEEVSAHLFPASINVVAIAGWNTLDDEMGRHATMEVVFREEGREEQIFRLQADLNRQRFRSLFRFENFMFQQVGTARFEIRVDGEHKASHEVRVLQVDAPAAVVPH
jgi:hypothetical protein